MKGNTATTIQVIVTVYKYNQRSYYPVIIKLCGHFSIPWDESLLLQYMSMKSVIYTRTSAAQSNIIIKMYQNNFKYVYVHEM